MDKENIKIENSIDFSLPCILLLFVLFLNFDNTSDLYDLIYKILENLGK